MKIVIDANRIIAALMREGTTRRILLNRDFEFLTPDFTLTEIRVHQDEIKLRAKLSDEEFEILLALIFECITIIPEADYSGFIEECKADVKDPDDVPYLALCVARRSDGIWTHDPHILEQKKIRTFTNMDMLGLGT